MQHHISRRNFLKVLGASSLALSQLDRMQAAFASAQPGSFLPIAIEDRDPTAHVINRLSFGITDALREHIAQIGVDAYIEEQLSPATINDSRYENAFSTFFPDLQRDTTDLFSSTRSMELEIGRLNAQLIGNTVYRAVYSERQLYERMVHFWTDHFNVHNANQIAIVLKVADDRDVIRQHAMGHFRDLLGASAHSPAMLYYLDNFTSSQEAPNENYARELLELHTLGVNGGYTEDDVKEVARCFTGWSFYRPRGQNAAQNSPIGTFVFNPRAHDNGEKFVLGHRIPAGGGIEDGEQVLDILAAHPSTARFVSSKLIRRFVSDTPPESLVEACAETFLRTNGDIVSVLRSIFNSAEFWNAPPKFKRPFEYTISILRPLNPSIRFRQFARPFAEAMQNLGHVPFQRPSPDGYPDVQAYWVSNLLMRWNIAIVAVQNGIPGAEMDIEGLLRANNVTLEAEPIIQWLAEYFYGRPLSEDESSVVLNYYANSDGSTTAIAESVALLLAAPAYQYR